MKKMHRPKILLILVDIGIILFNVMFVLGLFPLTSRTPFLKYRIPAVIFIISWIITSYLLKRYKPLKAQVFEKSGFRLFYTSIINFSLFGGFIFFQHASPFSQYVLFTIMAGVFIWEYVFLFIYFAYKYATKYEVPESTIEKRENAVLIPSEPLTLIEKSTREKKIKEKTNERIFNYLDKNTSLFDSSTRVLAGINIEKLQNLPNYICSTFIQLTNLNKIRGINKMLFLINEKLPDDGKIIIFYKTQSTVKRNIYDRFPVVISDFIYLSYFIFHRILPKSFFTQRIYYDFTRGERRILSKTEVLGRLIFCGFKIEKQNKIGDINVVIAKRVKQSEPIKPRRNYGPFIKLNRCGKDGKMFYVYKMRTMHPYSEFLQGYIYETNQLQEGGKFNKDIRVTSMGRFMRKYWLDELPMIFNLLKGDMKLIGVRPLSAHYFGLYSAELQEKRTKFRPGLLPPFYADMPKTLDEIQASELKYLNQCEKNGVLVTDVKYFFLILKNIIFKKAHSA